MTLTQSQALSDRAILPSSSSRAERARATWIKARAKEASTYGGLCLDAAGAAAAEDGPRRGGAARGGRERGRGGPLELAEDVLVRARVGDAADDRPQARGRAQVGHRGGGDGGGGGGGSAPVGESGRSAEGRTRTEPKCAPQILPSLPPTPLYLLAACPPLPPPPPSFASLSPRLPYILPLDVAMWIADVGRKGESEGAHLGE